MDRLFSSPDFQYHGKTLLVMAVTTFIPNLAFDIALLNPNRPTIVSYFTQDCPLDLSVLYINSCFCARITIRFTRREVSNSGKYMH